MTITSSHGQRMCQSVFIYHISLGNKVISALIACCPYRTILALCRSKVSQYMNNVSFLDTQEVLILRQIPQVLANYLQRRWTFLCLVACLCLFTPYISTALHTKSYEIHGVDEGLWTFDSPPLKLLFDRYKFTPTKEWLDTLRLATVRFTTGGGSGAFVSPRGLVITNHHVVLEQLQRLSTKERDIIANGYTAATSAQELRCPDMELHVLVEMENITSRMFRVVKKGMTDEELFIARQAEIRRIEAAYSSDRTNTRAEVVTLYSGGEYWLYHYKRYTDVRLVAAPELQAANFGGDYDNFTYPRYALDFALVRVYEHGKPIQSQHYLKWNTKGCVLREPVFVAGYPGSTNRLNTYSQFVFNRDVFYPFMLRRINSMLATARRYSERGSEQSRRALEDILNDENIKKSFVGEYQGLMDKTIEMKCRQSENDLRQKIAADRDLTNLYGNARETVDRVVQKQTVIFKEYTSNFSTPLADIAFSIIRYALEKENVSLSGLAADKSIDKSQADKKMPNTDRYAQRELLEELRVQSLSPVVIALDYEEVRLAGELEFLLSELSAGDSFVRSMLGEGSILRTPADVARDAVRGTRLTDMNFRKTLLEGGRKAIERSTDPMIVFMRKLVPLWLEREEYQRNNIQAPLAAALEKIALARFAVYGKSAYPDANFSLRLSIGTMQGYSMNGTLAPPLTTLYGLFDRAASFVSSDIASDFMLPPRMAVNRELSQHDKIPLSTPVNFATTCDIIGGSSGSPLVNRNLEFVGLVFDGNIESLSGRFVYNEETGRTLCVHPAFIIEALRKMYNASSTADELEGAKINSIIPELQPTESKPADKNLDKMPEKNFGKPDEIKRTGEMARSRVLR